MPTALPAALPTALTRGVLTVLVPGVIAVTPWAIFLAPFVEPRIHLARVPNLDYVLLFALVVVWGTVVDGIGGWIEHGWDERREDQYQVRQNWRAYLASKFQPEPVGYRYISRTLTAMKFELAMLFASPFFFFGVAVLWMQRVSTICWPPFAIVILGLLGVAYFYYQASNSHRLLCTLRKQLHEDLLGALDPGTPPPTG